MSRSVSQWLGVSVAVLLCVSVFWFGDDSDSGAPVGIVIPHHDMVASARAAFMTEIGERVSPRTIVLLSPDHFGTSVTPLSASTRTWTTVVGDLVPDFALIEALGLPQDKASFATEHGITTVLRDIKTNFPDSAVVPIILSSQISFEEISSFTRKLYDTCPDCLLIASVDFSHALERKVSRLHDTLTLRELSRQNAARLYADAEVDSPASLAALATWAKLHKADHFSLFTHTNSGDITGMRVGEMTTHIIGSYEKGSPSKKYEDTITLMFGGDVMFDRGVEMAHRTDPARALTGTLGERFFWGVDVAMVNLEGVFGTEELVTKTEQFPPVFTFQSTFIKAVTDARITVVGIANNHHLDGGESGYSHTQALALSNGITAIGNRQGNNPDVFTHQEGKTRVAIMTINLLSDAADLAPKITEYTAAGYFVIVYAHFGKEEESIANADQKAAAQRFIDAGAALIIGSHPHVVQPVSLYKGVPIVYSLGNFLFDQNQSAAVQLGAVLGVTIDATEVELFLVPVASYLRPLVVTEQYPDWTSAWASYESPIDSGRYRFARQR